MKKKLAIGALLALVAMLALPGVAYAAVPQPDTLQINGVEVYRNCLEPLDQLYVVRHTVEYAAPPGGMPSISEAYLVRLMNGAAELGAEPPFAYSTLGYEYGVATIYFTAAEVAAAGMGWGAGTGYSISLQGNPALDWTGGPPSTQSTTFDLWFDGGTVADTEARLTARLRTLAVEIETDWGADLIETAAGVLKLTANGEYYFEAVIDDLRVMCPNLFGTLVSVAEFEQWSGAIVGEYHTGGNDTVQVCDNNDWAAQTFTAVESYSVNGVFIRANRSGTPGNVTASIRLTAAGLPTGADLASGTYNGNDLVTYTAYASGEWVHVPFTTSYAMTQDTVYAICVRSAAASVNWAVDTDDGYAAGQGCSSNNGGVAWAALGGGGYDFMFSNTGSEAHAMSYAKQLESRLVGTKFDMSNLAANAGVQRIWMSTIVWFIVSVGVCWAVARFTNSYKPTSIVMFGMMPAGAYAGFIPLVVAVSGGLLAGGMMIYVFFYRGAHA